MTPLRQVPTRAWAGGLLAVMGGGLTVLLAFVGSTDEPPSASVQALIAFLAILGQAGAAWAFSGVGKADPSLAERAVSRLVRRAQRALEARRLAEWMTEQSGTSTSLRNAAGQLSVHLSYLEEGLVESVDDWRTFHPSAVERAEKGNEVDDE